MVEHNLEIGQMWVGGNNKTMKSHHIRRIDSIKNNTVYYTFWETYDISHDVNKGTEWINQIKIEDFINGGATLLTNKYELW